MLRRLASVSALLLLAACVPSPKRNVAPTDHAASSPSSSAISSIDSGNEGELDVTVEPFEEPLRPILSTGALVDITESRDADTLVIGNENAPLSITVYLNPLSPYARDFQRLRMPLLIEHYVRTGNLAIRLVTLPIDKYDGEADAVRTTICAADQDKGYAAHERLYRDGVTSLDVKTLSAIGVNIDMFDGCIATMSGDVLAPLSMKARTDGVTLVPTYVIRGKIHVGLPTQADLEGAIKEAL